MRTTTRRATAAIALFAALASTAGVAVASHRQVYRGHGDGSSVTVKLIRHGRTLDFVVKFRRTARGTFRTRVQNNEVLCDTGVVHWTARRR